MYFLWRDTPDGLVKISHEGLFDFADYVLRSGFRFCSITLAPKEDNDNTDLMVVISDEDLRTDTKKHVEEHLREVFEPMGMRASVVWASPERGIWPFIQSPHTWAVIASCLTVIFTAGFGGFFWTAFWGAAAWFAVKSLAILTKKIRSA